MSQQQAFNNDSLPMMPNIEFIQGNDSVPVGPDPVTHIFTLIGNTTQGVSITNTAPYTDTVTVASATTSQIGVTSLATNAETIAGTVTTKATTPDDIKAKLGVQTAHGIPYGEGTTSALGWLAEASNGQIPIGSTGNPPVLANITSLDGSITVTNGAGTIDLSNASQWTTILVTSASPTNPIQIVKNTTYVCNGVSNVTFILPLAPALGDLFEIISNTATFEITENASQQMSIGGSITTAGSGNVQSNAIGDIGLFRYVGSNLFIGKSQGTLTFN